MARWRATSSIAGSAGGTKAAAAARRNNHFTRDVLRADGSRAYIGYGVDSLLAGLAAICRVRFFGASRDAVAPLYPTAEDARITVGIIEAAATRARPELRLSATAPGCSVTARFGPDGITIIDPNRGADGAASIFERIYDQPF